MDPLSPRDREANRLYEEWIKSLDPSQREEAAKLRILKPIMDSVSSAVSLSADAAESAHNSYENHPQEQIEPITPDDLKALGRSMGRIFVWLFQAKSLVALGQRTWVLGYVVRPDLIEGQTLEQFGSKTNVTRQAIDKLAQSFQDEIGITGRNMRSSEARVKYQAAQKDKE